MEEEKRCANKQKNAESARAVLCRLLSRRREQVVPISISAPSRNNELYPIVRLKKDILIKIKR